MLLQFLKEQSFFSATES